jgi:hypothetical protein
MADSMSLIREVRLTPAEAYDALINFPLEPDGFSLFFHGKGILSGFDNPSEEEYVESCKKGGFIPHSTLDFGPVVDIDQKQQRMGAREIITNEGETGKPYLEQIAAKELFNDGRFAYVTLSSVGVSSKEDFLKYFRDYPKRLRDHYDLTSAHIVLGEVDLVNSTYGIASISIGSTRDSSLRINEKFAHSDDEVRELIGWFSSLGQGPRSK